MLQRISCVDRFNIATVSFSSTIQIGDSEEINGFSRAIAVQREPEIYFGSEGNFNAYSIFSEPIPFLPIQEEYHGFKENMNPVIKVRTIDIIGASSSSIVHIGNTRHVCLEARVKHIRQLLPHDEQKKA